MPSYQPLKARFWSKVNTNGDCWEWMGAKSGGGYGCLALPRGNGKSDKAHRISWQLHRGPIPYGKHVLHACDNPGCVNPDHLWLGNHVDNMLDMARKGRAVPKPQMGEMNDFAKLTEASVKRIRKLASEGVQQKVLANRFGVSRACICNVVNRKTWTEI